MLTLSVPPVEELGDASVTVPLAQEANDELAELCDPTTALPGSPSVSDVEASLAEP